MSNTRCKYRFTTLMCSCYELKLSKTTDGRQPTDRMSAFAQLLSSQLRSVLLVAFLQFSFFHGNDQRMSCTRTSCGHSHCWFLCSQSHSCKVLVHLFLCYNQDLPILFYSSYVSMPWPCHNFHSGLPQQCYQERKRLLEKKLIHLTITKGERGQERKNGYVSTQHSGIRLPLIGAAICILPHLHWFLFLLESCDPQAFFIVYLLEAPQTSIFFVLSLINLLFHLHSLLTSFFPPPS